jgi:broad specificity phosphatase PhoE
MRTIYFITHPDVEIDPAIPVPEWRLSTRGRKRMHSLLNQPWVRHLSAVWCSTERKANDGAEIIANAIGKVPLHLATLGENDRSATGYLPKAEFEAAADAFFAQSYDSVRGWDRCSAPDHRSGRNRCGGVTQRRRRDRIARRCRGVTVVLAEGMSN